MGRHQAATPPTATELYDELGTIGTKYKSIRPLILERTHHLLNAPAVRQQAGPSSSNSSLALAAHRVLREAISSIPTDTSRLVAEAVLAATPQFEGTSVESRKALLTELPNGCNADKYKRLRKQSLLHIVNHLLSEHARATGLPISRRSTSSESLPYVAARLESMAESAIELYYSIVAHDFMIYQRHNLFNAGVSPDDLWAASDPKVLNEWSRRGLGAYVNYQMAFRLRAAGTNYSGLLPASATDTARCLFETSLLQGPPAMQSVSFRLLQIYNLEAHGLISLTEENSYSELFFNAWKPWYDSGASLEEMLTAGFAPAIPPKRFVAAKAYALHRLISRHATLQRPYRDMAAQRARRYLCAAFPFDEWMPLAENRSLVEYVSLYFEEQQAAIDVSHLEWYGCSHRSKHRSVE